MSAWSLPLDRWAQAAQADIETVVRKVTFEAFRRVVLKSPVDTGRFRANWNFGWGVPDFTTTAATNEGRGLAEAARALTAAVGGVAHFSNGLPYGERLEYGYSKQAPAGMIRTTVAEFQQITSAAARSRQ